METFQSDMSSEFKRYATFNGFQTPPEVWPSQLAQAGFYRSGTCREFQVICFACGRQLDVRTVKRDSLMEIHRRLSPMCSFVSGSANNQPVPPVDSGAALEWLTQSFAFGALEQQQLEENESMLHTQSLPQRQGWVPDTTEGSSSSLPIIFPAGMFSSAGDELPYLPILSNISTLEQPDLSSLPSGFLSGFENATLDSGPSGAMFSQLGGPGEALAIDGVSDGIEGEYPTHPIPGAEISNYMQAPPPPQMQTEGELGDVPHTQKVTLGDLGIVIQRPKRQDLATYPKRLNTFERWLGRNISQPKEVIAEAGFYYAGMYCF